jgi:hypothetical protein
VYDALDNTQHGRVRFTNVGTTTRRYIVHPHDLLELVGILNGVAPATPPAPNAQGEALPPMAEPPAPPRWFMENRPRPIPVEPVTPMFSRAPAGARDTTTSIAEAARVFADAIDDATQRFRRAIQDAAT